MAFITGSDEMASCEFIVFSSVFDSISEVSKGDIVLIRGKVDKKDNILFFNFSLNELYQFHKWNDQKGKYKANGIFIPADGSEAKGVGQERNFQDQGSQHQRSQHCCPQDLILLFEGKDRLSLRAQVEGVENLTHRHGKERHRHTVTGFTGSAQCCEEAFAKFHIAANEVSDDRQSRYQNALVSNVCEQAAGKDTLFGISGRTLHRIRLCLFHTQRQRRETVRN